MFSDNFEVYSKIVHQVLHKYCVLSNYYVVIRSCSHADLNYDLYIQVKSNLLQ